MVTDSPFLISTIFLFLTHPTDSSTYKPICIPAQSNTRCRLPSMLPSIEGFMPPPPGTCAVGAPHLVSESREREGVGATRDRTEYPPSPSSASASVSAQAASPGSAASRSQSPGSAQRPGGPTRCGCAKPGRRNCGQKNPLPGSHRRRSERWDGKGGSWIWSEGRRLFGASGTALVASGILDGAVAGLRPRARRSFVVVGGRERPRMGGVR